MGDLVAGSRDRGLVDRDGSLADSGRTARQWVEDRTDPRAMVAWERIGATGCQRLREIFRPFSKAIVEHVSQLRRLERSGFVGICSSSFDAMKSSESPTGTGRRVSIRQSRWRNVPSLQRGPWPSSTKIVAPVTNSEAGLHR